MKIILIYAIVAIIYLLINLLIQYIKLGKSQFKIIASIVLAGEKGRKFKKYFLTWYGIPLIVIPAVIIICQFMFPYYLFIQLKKLYIKRALEQSKSKKLAEAALKDYQSFNNEEEMLPPVIN